MLSYGDNIGVLLQFQNADDIATYLADKEIE
jgi:hypothetical protein